LVGILPYFAVYRIRTEEAYVRVVRRYILFHGKRHPAEMGVEEIRQYLSFPASHDNVSASIQNQALSALLFLYREVLSIELPLKLLGDADVQTTMIYTHVLNKGARGVKSPLEL
jgi:site-specific recombinase XerD